jgi:hypothetical protein
MSKTKTDPRAEFADVSDDEVGAELPELGEVITKLETSLSGRITREAAERRIAAAQNEATSRFRFNRVTQLLTSDPNAHGVNTPASTELERPADMTRISILTETKLAGVTIGTGSCKSRVAIVSERSRVDARARPSQERASQAWPRSPRPLSAPARAATRASVGGPPRPRSTSPRSVLTAPWRDGR